MTSPASAGAATCETDHRLFPREIALGKAIEWSGVRAVPLLLGGDWWAGAVVGAVAAGAATLGDLIESSIKRDLGIKDMGALLPGHGGMMDRLDSLVVVAPVAWALLMWFVPVT